MGVEKYRSGEEMNRAPVRVRAAEGFDRFIRHCARYHLLASPSFPRGVFKFRSLAEAQAERDRITRENIRRTRRAKQPSGASS